MVFLTPKGRLRGRTPFQASVQGPPRVPLPDHEALIRAVADRCRDGGVTAIFLHLPVNGYYNWGSVADRAGKDDLRRLRRPNAPGAAGSAIVVDASPLRAREGTFIDDMHLSPEGAERVAALLADAIVGAPGRR